MSVRERELLLTAFDSNWIAPLGPMVDRFEREFAQFVGCQSAAALSSGTAALHLILLGLGIGKGDYVLVSSFTFAATVNAIIYCGAIPVFIDSERESWNLDAELVEEALVDLQQNGIRPKALVTVDLYGQCANYPALEKVLLENDIFLIEDASEALGAWCAGRMAGTFGVAAAFSFNGNKIMTTSGGGMAVSEDESLIRKIRYLASQARQPLPHYEHNDVGFNYRLSNLLAAVGIGQLAWLPERIQRRKAIREKYEEALGALPGLQFMPIPAWSQPNYWLTCIMIDPLKAGTSREQLRLALEKENIESRPLWKPMPMQPVFFHYRDFGTGVSKELFDTGLCLPSGSSLQDEEIDFICCIIREQFKKD